MAHSLARALADYVVEWRAAPWPLPWAERFARQAPLVLEIGFGNGAFLEREAKAHPERDHVGIELSWTAATHLLRRLQRCEIANARALLGDAEFLVRHLFWPASLAAVFVNHPCPWPKARHTERRLLDRAFLELLGERMQPGAVLTVVTDHAEYGKWLGEELRAQRALESCHATLEAPPPPGREPTKYQLKAMAQGIPIHYFEWRRVPDLVPSGTSAIASEPSMPTLTLFGASTGTQPFEGFRPQRFRERHREDEVVVKLEAVYRRVDGTVWLVETFVQEGRLRQQFGIDVVAREDTLLVKPSSLGDPYPTHGVKRAVWCVGRWLASRDPLLRVRSESLGLAEPSEPWPPASS
jgi:tRNA (guanine-N7-)-methyltransferase